MALYDTITISDLTEYHYNSGEVTTDFRFYLIRNGEPAFVRATIIWDVYWEQRHRGPVCVGRTPVACRLANVNKAVRLDGETIKLRTLLDLMETAEWLKVDEGQDALAVLCGIACNALEAHAYETNPDGRAR